MGEGLMFQSEISRSQCQAATQTLHALQDIAAEATILALATLYDGSCRKNRFAAIKV